MSLSNEVERKAPKESWWTTHKTRAEFNAAHQARVPEMPNLGNNSTMGANAATGAIRAKRLRRHRTSST